MKHNKAWNVQGTEKSKNEVGKASRGRMGSTERGGLTFIWKPLKDWAESVLWPDWDLLKLPLTVRSRLQDREGMDDTIVCT